MRRVRPRAFGRRLLAAAAVVATAVGCGGAGGVAAHRPIGGDARAPVELHASSGRPPLAVVRRAGDPFAAVAISIRLDARDPERVLAGAALGALFEDRLSRAGMLGIERFAGGRMLRVRGLVGALDAATINAIDRALRTPVNAVDPSLGAARRALDDARGWPAFDPALARAAECLERPMLPQRADALERWRAQAKLAERLEQARDAAMRADAVVIALVGQGPALDEAERAWAATPAWTPGAAEANPTAPAATADPTPALTTSAGFDGGALVIEGIDRARVPSVLAALGAPEAPLAARLRAAEDFRLRAAHGAARAEGGCVVIEVEPSAGGKRAIDAERLVSETAVALQIAREEAELAVDASVMRESDAARLAVAKGTDPREAADRAAWWAWPATTTARRTTSLAFAVGPGRLARSLDGDLDAALAALGSRLAPNVDRARIAAARPELELRAAAEPGQGELWIALGTTCGTAHELANDAGLGALAMASLVRARGSTDAAGGASTAGSSVSLAPWATPFGLGLVAHAAPMVSESETAFANRIGDAIGRAMFATFPEPDDVALVRAEALERFRGAAVFGDLVRAGLFTVAGDHPSWLDADGLFDAVAKAGREAVVMRLATLRQAPLRLAMLTNAGDERGAQSQAAAIDRAIERWVPRRPGESRSCPIIEPPSVGKGAMHLVSVRAGAGFSIAIPVDDAQLAAAEVLASMIGGPHGRLARELGASGLVASSDARVIRGIGRHALVIVAVAPDANVEAALATTRALVARLRTGEFDASDLASASAARASATAMRRLDPRARVLELFAGRDRPPATPDLATTKSVAARLLDEDLAQVVVARP